MLMLSSTSPMEWQYTNRVLALLHSRTIDPVALDYI